MELLQKIIQNPINQKVLEFLKIDTSSKSILLKNWEITRSGFDDAGIDLFNDFGENIPNECKYSFETHNILVEPNYGEIFAFSTGRYSLFLKCDFEFFGLTNSDKYRKGYTFDCITDITELGNEWAFMDEFEDSESEKLERAYEVAKNRN